MKKIIILAILALGCTSTLSQFSKNEISDKFFEKFPACALYQRCMLFNAKGGDVATEANQRNCDIDKVFCYKQMALNSCCYRDEANKCKLMSGETITEAGRLRKLIVWDSIDETCFKALTESRL